MPVRQVANASPMERLQADLFDRRRIAYRMRAERQLEVMRPHDPRSSLRFRSEYLEVARNRYITEPKAAQRQEFSIQKRKYTYECHSSQPPHLITS